MSYVVLARKYRPQRLEEVIGQDHVSKTLRNALSENRIAHAYLFSGPRGVGKTTMARILAKALNCKDPKDLEPCGKCSNCVEIAYGSSVDVQEIDAASNRGIDDIRTLRENVKFAPAASKYKVYIIDEAHQITNEGFNALLKTLEEPPPHVVFIMATTEAHKMPITILSRCQRYRFRLLSSKEIMAHLEKIVKTENFSIDPEALQIITSASGGSARDALSLLDQAVSAVSGKVTAKDVQNLLGFSPKEIIAGISGYLSKEDSSGILTTVKNITEQGFNLLQFGRDLRDYLRNLMLYKVNPDIVEATLDDKKLFESQKGFFTEAWLIRSGHLISRALDEMRWNDNPRIILELYLMRMAQPYLNAKELFDRLDKLEKDAGIGPSVPETAEKTVKSVSPAPASAVPTEYKLREEKPEPENLVSEKPSSNGAKYEASANQDFQSVWQEFVGVVNSSRPLIGSFLTNAFLKEFNDNALVIGVQNKFEESGLKSNAAFIEEYIKNKLGKSIPVKVSFEPGKVAPKSAASVQQEEIVVEEESSAGQAVEFFEVKEESPAEKIPHGLEKILDKFPGKIKKKPLN